LWTGPIKDNGYGVMPHAEGRHNMSAHRISWELHFGPIPAGMNVCHHCDVRHCVRPDHLFVGTHVDNMQDCLRKGRHVSNIPAFQRGERHPCAKLTATDVMKIHELRRGGMSGLAIAKMFPVKWQQIYKILRGERWRQEGEMRG
jgi:uncharacterized protein (DUF433 family)